MHQERREKTAPEEGERFVNPPSVGYLAELHTVQLKEITGTVATATTKANTTAEQRAIKITLHQFLANGSSDL